MSDGMTEANRQSCYAQLEEIRREYGEIILKHRALEAENARLREALAFYAGRLRPDGNGYEFDEEPEIYLGALARKALANHSADADKMVAPPICKCMLRAEADERADAKVCSLCDFPGREGGAVSEVVAKAPSAGLLMSMALRYDHALGCPGYYDQRILKTEGVTHAQKLAATLSIMRQLYDEVSGHGFYSPPKEQIYADMMNGMLKPDAKEQP